MKNAVIFLAAALVLAICPAAPGLDPMGPPAAGLKKGQMRAGAEYSRSRMDVALTDGKASVNWSTSAQADRISIHDLEMNKVYGTIGYGAADWWELFVRLGYADAGFSKQNFLEPSPPTGVCAGCTDENGFDSGSGIAVGLGTKVTLHEQEKLKYGGLFQISWVSLSGTERRNTSLVNSQWTHQYDIDATITEIQLALGPTYEPVKGLAVYGGPFFHIIDGHLDTNYNQTGTVPGPTTVVYNGKYRYDIDQQAFFGGYVGTQFDVADGVTFIIEYQHTAAADAVAMALLGRF
jgi:hypothetical protein